MENIKVSETLLAKYEFENSILKVKCKEGIVIDQDTMKQILLEAVSCTNYEKYFAIIDLTNDITSTHEARNYYAKNELIKYRFADAFIVNSLYIQSLTNFYLRVKKPIIPSKMFNDLESAKKWIFSIKESVFDLQPK